MPSTKDHGVWRAHVTLSKWSPETIFSVQARHGVTGLTYAELLSLGVAPDEVLELPNNLLTNRGITVLESLLIAAAGQTSFSSTNARLGVGDGNGSVPTATAADTALTASTNRYFQSMDATFPSVSAQTVTFQATYTTSQANFVWNEWSTDNDLVFSAVGTTQPQTATTGIAMLNHKGVAMGTKVSGAQWTLKAQITVS